MSAQPELIALEDREAWRSALDGVPHGFHHTWDYANAIHLTTGHPTSLVCFSDGPERMLCPIVERQAGEHVDIATPSGLSGFVGTAPWARFSSQWAEFVKERRYVTGYVGLHPLFEPPGLAHLAPQHNSIYVLQLGLGVEGLRQQMSRKRRAELREWEARAKDFVIDKEALSRFLIDTYEPFMRRVGARPPHMNAETLAFLCDSEATLCVGAASHGEIEAVYLFASTPYSADCLINVGTPAGRRRATDLLWFGVNQFVDTGIGLLNLGGGVREDDRIAFAKQRFGAQRLPLRALRQTYRPNVYAELCRDVGVAPTAEPGFFPAYRAPAATVLLPGRSSCRALPVGRS